MDTIFALAEKNTRRAREVIAALGVVPAWESIGAKVNPVGSLQTGLLVKHLDIDFHIYTPELHPGESFRAMGKMADVPGVQRVAYTDLINTEECCLEWHLWYADQDGQVWQIDMIHILQGSAYDGFAERAAERIAAVLTPETRAAVLRLKYDTPEDVKIMGIEYYQAVLRDGVRSYPEFAKWREQNPPEGIILWAP